MPYSPLRSVMVMIVVLEFERRRGEERECGIERHRLSWRGWERVKIWMVLMSSMKDAGDMT